MKAVWKYYGAIRPWHKRVPWRSYENGVKKGRGGKIEVDIFGELYYYCNY
ncbi:hypothetical protein QMP26_05120 [Enterocloster clostridioformis]